MARLRGALILIAFLAMTLALIPVQALINRAWPSRSAYVPLRYHRAVLRLLDIRLDIEGHLCDGPVLITSNHVSWLDISVLSAIGGLSFIAKKEVASWPGFGTLARLQRTVFVDRDKRNHTGRARSEIERRLDAGDRMVLFAEGTSSDGNRVLPFRTALFGAAAYTTANGRRVAVQPLSLAYVRLHGLPIGRPSRPMFAWYGDMSMVPHVWEILCSGPIDARIVLHEPVTIDDFADRKALAADCEGRVRAGVLGSLIGRQVKPDQVAGAAPAPAGTA